MAKKKSGYYSPEAIQARQQFAVDEYNRVNNQNNQQAQQQQDAPKGATATVADPNYTVRTPSAKSDFKTSIDGNNWNYINAKTDMQGKPIETRNFMGRTITPKGFDPNGNPYFGEGVNGWLQKWAYKLSEESATQGESQQAWQKFAETSNQFSRNAMSATYKSQQDYFSQDAQKLNKEQFSLFIQGAGELFDASRKWLESQDQNFASGAATGGFKTPITYALRAVNAAVGMTLEGFQWLSEVPEKIGGAQRAMREYATERGSMLPELTFDPLGDDYYERVKNDPKFASMYAPDNGFKANKEAADFASRLFVVPLAMYDYVRFFTSPGTAQEKKVAVQKGWIEGRMLYTEIFKDTVREEYLSRVRAGEDPALLAMEMEDPWIEAGMEMLLDPSNFLGLLGKAEKAASTITEAGRVVENSGLLSKTEFISEIKNISKVDNDIDAAERAGKVAQMIADESTLQARRLASAQEYKLTSYVPEANKIIHRKTMGNYISAVTQALRNAGGTPDDVLDFVNALRKFATGDITEIRDGMATISHMPIQMMAYNDAAFEVGYMMNKILGEGDFAQALEKGGGNFSELAKWFDDKMTKATNYAFPSVLEMQRAGEKAKELAKVGEAIPEETQRLSEAFKALQKEHPGYVKWANFQDIANKTLRPINGFLANNYFSLSYGYAARNFMQNMFTLWVDGGLVWDSKGLAKTERLDNIILRLNGGQMPEMFKETETLIKSTTEGSLGNRFFSWLNSKKYSPAQLGQAAEIYAGKMIYVKKYRETMDSIATLGGMLPEVAKWEDAGFTASQANDFVDLLRANDYDEVATFEAFSRKYGDGTVDKWRQLDWVNPEAKKGLQESGSYWDEISQFVNKEGNPTQREVLDFIDELKQRVKKDALKVTDEPTRVLDSDPIAKAVMDDREFAGKYGNADVDNALLSQKLQASRAMNEFETALREMMLSVAKNPDEASQTLARKIVNEFNAAPKEVEKVLQDTDEMRRFVVDLRNRVSRGENPALLWDESIMGKKPKGLISKDMFLKQLWEGHYFPKRSEMWNSYYANKLEKYMEFAKEQPGLSMLFEKANYENLKYQQYADYVYSNGKIFAKPPVLVSAAVGSTENANNIRSIANAYGISSIANSGANKDKAVLNIINKYAPPSYVDEAGQAVEAYAKLEDVPPDVAEKVFSQYSGQTPKGFIKKNGEVYEANNLLEGLPVPPPRDPNTSPAGHVFTETKDGMLSALNHIEQGIRDRWGLKISTNGDMNALQNILPDLTERVAIAKSKSQIVAEKYRDFALLPYAERTNMDMALGIVYPYQFWYSRSYKNWMQRAFMTNPEIISRYANLKEALATEQRDLPDWWKSQFDVMGFLGGSDKKLFGIDTSHPMYINLEAAVFPLYGLTGTDFNDPKKRVDWWSSTLDDMGKFGPSIWAPLQVATAAYYAAVGEKDVAARWGGRLIPQTQTIKAVTGLLGKPVELDPSIWAFNGGMDSYEEGRVNRALAAMANEGYSQEELMQAAYSKSGPLWDEAYRRAVVERAPGQISSFLLGTGFKGRTENDVMIDQFYSDYSRMQNLYRGGLMTDAQYQEAFRVLREQYPFTDVLLLSRRAGDRDSAYAYNVLSRIPPAELNQVSEVLGVKPYMIEQFYSNKGDLSKMTPQDKARFMAAIVDLGAMLKMPDGATREEWNAARQTYAEMNRMLAQSYGSDIQDKISRYYDLSTDERKQYLEAYPEVSQALEDKTAYITNTPVLSAYYGGLDTIERYYSNQIYDQLEQEFGQDIQDKMEQYYFLKDNLQPKDAKRYYNENNLKAYEARKKELQKQIDAKIIEMAKNIPEGTGYQIRPDFQVQSGYQQDALNYATVNQQAQTAQEIYGQLSPAAQELLQEYYDKGTKLPYAVTRQIDYIAGKYGLSQYEALRLMGVELP